MATLSRKAMAIKRREGDMLSRMDLQYDLLAEIMNDKHDAFTNPFNPRGPKMNFRDLYLDSILRSPKASRVLRDKMVDQYEFGTDFAMISLLCNVGKINTTMAFFVEMRTQLRSFHPVPSLQRTDGNLQDAPRIKNIIKSCVLPDDEKPPSTPSDITDRRNADHIPSTTAANLLTVMAGHAVPLGQAHFHDSTDFLDLFLPSKYTSASRARAFLWLCYHYLESTQNNPFDRSAGTTPGKIPPLIEMTQEELDNDNVDSELELQVAAKMTAARREFLTKHEAATAAVSALAATTPLPKPKPRARKAEAADSDTASVAEGTTVDAESASFKRKRAVPAAKTKDSVDSPVANDASETTPARRSSRRRTASVSYVEEDDDMDLDLPPPPPPPPPPATRRAIPPAPPPVRMPPPKQEPPMYDPIPAPSAFANGSHASRPKPHQTRSNEMPRERAPYHPPPLSPQFIHEPDERQNRHRAALQKSWSIIKLRDPLEDSDDETTELPDIVRQEYKQRLKIVARLRGRL